MSNTFDKKLLNGEVTLKLLQGLKTKIDSSDVQATRVKGVLDIANIPPSALPTLKVVQNDTERFQLTSRDVKRGDTVKVIETNKLYLVTDTSRLSSPEGYTEYAQTVNWDTIQGRPETFKPSEHTQATSTINSLQGYVKGEETSGLSPSDTLNAALSKLESSLGLKLNRNIPELKGTEKDIVNSINKNVGQFIKGQIDNMDLVTETGWYLCNSNCTGAPATFEGIVMNFNGGEGTSVKVWYSVTQESMYIKQTFPGVVKQEWTKVITKADVDEVKGAIEQAISAKQNKTDETLLTRDKNVTGAINELHTEKQSKNDGRLQTVSKDIVGAINELKDGKANSVHDHNNLYNTKEEITQLLATKENNIVKNTAFNKNFGITSGTVLEGDKYEDLLTTFESGQSRLEGVIQKKLDQTGGTITGDLTVNGTLITANNKGVQCKDNVGTPKTVIQIDTNNNVKVGDSTSKIILDSSDVELKGGNSLWTSGNFTPSEKQNVNDPTLQTSTKTVVGAINEVLTSTKEVASNLGTKAPLVHTHDDRYTPTATLDVRLSEIEDNVSTKEPIIADKKTAFNKDFGTTVGTVLEGNNLAVLEGKINEKQNKTDILLTTSDKTIVGAINEIKANTLGSTGGKVDGAINSVEHNGAGNYNIIESDGRTVHGTLYGRATASDGIGEVGLYNKKSQKGIRLKDDGNTLIDSKSLTTVSKEMTGAINELNEKKFDKTGGTLTGVGEILKIKNNDTRGSAYISFFNDGIKKGWIGRGSSGIDSIAMHNQYSGKGLTLKHDGGTHIDAMNLNTKSKEVIGAINELNVGKMSVDGSTKMKGSISFDYGTPQAPNIKFLDQRGTIHGSLNARGGDVDEDIYLENNVGGNGLFLKDNGEVHLSSKRMRITAPNLETNSKEMVGAINELNTKKLSLDGGTMSGTLFIQKGTGDPNHITLLAGSRRGDIFLNQDSMSIYRRSGHSLNLSDDGSIKLFGSSMSFNNHTVWDNNNFNPQTKLDKKTIGSLIGFINGTVGLYIGNNNEINLSSFNREVYFGYRQVGDSKVDTYNFGDSSETGSSPNRRGQINAKNIALGGGDVQGNVTISNTEANHIHLNNGNIHGEIFCNVEALSMWRSNSHRLDLGKDEVVNIRGKKLMFNDTSVWSNFTSPHQSGRNGYQKLPSGVYIQWGYQQIQAAVPNQEIRINLPLAFSERHGYGVCITPYDYLDSQFWVDDLNAGWFSVKTKYSGSVVGIKWIAIGY